MRQARPPKEIPPPLELECLKALWAIEQGNVKAVQEHLAARRALAYTTVMTLLDRLTRKGVVARRKTGRFFVYSPLVDCETMRKRAINDLAETLFNGSRGLLLKYLQDGGGVAHSLVAPVEERLDAALL